MTHSWPGGQTHELQCCPRRQGDNILPTHTPLAQCWPGLQAWPQRPQLSLSLFRSLQVPLQHFQLEAGAGAITVQAAPAAVGRVVVLVYARPVAAILVIGAKMHAIAADAPPALEVGANTSTQKGTAVRVIGWADTGRLAAADTYPTYGAGNARPGEQVSASEGHLCPHTPQLRSLNPVSTHCPLQKV